MSVEQPIPSGGEPVVQEMPPSAVLRLAGKHWAAGGRWVTPTEKPKDAKQVAAEARALRANAVAVRKPTRMQAVGQTPQHHVGYYRISGKSGSVYSLGAALAERKVQGWAATFALADGRYLYVVVLPGNAIDPSEHGEVIGNRQDVESARAAHFEWVKDLQYDEGTSEDLEAILRQVKEPVRVRPVRAPRERRALFPVVAAVAVVGSLGWFGIHRYRAHEAAIAAAQAAARERARESRLAILQNPLVADMSTAVLFARCAPAIDALPLAAPNGAQLGDVTCTPAMLVADWDQIDGQKTRTVEALSHYVPRFERTGRLPAIPQVPPVPIQLSALRMMAARGGFTVDTSDVTALPGASPQAHSAEPQQRVQLVFSFSPWSAPLGAIPGLRVSAVTFNQSKWIVDGVIYGD